VNGGKSTQGKKKRNDSTTAVCGLGETRKRLCAALQVLNAAARSTNTTCGGRPIGRAQPPRLEGIRCPGTSRQIRLRVLCGFEARSIGQQIAANPCGPSLQAAARRRTAIRWLSGGAWPPQRGLRRLER